MVKYIIRDLMSASRYLPHGLIVGLLVAAWLTFINYRRKKKGKPLLNVAALTCFIGYLAVLLLITLLSRESGSNKGIDMQIGSTLGINTRNDAYVVENILLFIPLGVVCPWVFPSLRKFLTCTLTGAAISTGIECFQLFTGRGFFQIDDILTNTLGMAVGFLLFCLFFKR